MIKKLKYLTIICLLNIIATQVHAQDNFKLIEKFDSANSNYPKTGRGIAEIGNSVLTTKDAYLSFGESTWADYEIKFKARVPQSEAQVQICTGFRAANRDDRYIVMLKGGNERFLYLARLGYMGSDDFLALRQLDFQPAVGQWYQFKIQVAGARIRVFLNDETLPRIDVTDKSTALAPAGKVTLGGSWITNEFDDLTITPLKNNFFSGERVREYAKPTINKNAERVKERKEYRPLTVNSLTAKRTEISLNGKWLFAPGYEVGDDAMATDPGQDDQNWHIMNVPDFWNPIRVWLFGEKYNTGSKGVADNFYQKETDRCEAYTFDYKKTSTAWYRHWINLPQSIAGKNLQLSFDAVSKVAEVYINGQRAGSHIGMFGDFKVDGTSLFKPGKNLITVKVVRDYVKNIQDADKVIGVAVTVPVTQKMTKDLAHGFYGDDPAGIWQPVSLIITNQLRIQDVFIKPSLTGADCDVTVKNYSDKPADFSVGANITGAQPIDALYNGVPLKGLQLQPGEEKVITCHIDNLKPRLWSPEHPNLYNFKFSLLGGNVPVDAMTIRSGFRTFQAIGGYLYLNGQRYWLRGGNQTAMPLAPNDTVVADKFCQLMKAGNIMITRSHTVPYSETWMNASDVNGIGVSYEGTWPWLFLGASMPSANLIDLWQKEFLDLLKKYRNHPSLLIWTVNNEMKFYDNDPDDERARIKMQIISNAVKQMRTVDPTRPVVFDSNYDRNTKRFGVDFYKDIDDGDIDDTHAYYNWYDNSIFDYFNGEWQKKYKNSGRPLISQEMSTGYTDETGHATRFYNYVHQNPESLAGKYTYEYCDPKYFETAQGFITKELAEALRRSDDQASGVLHFSAATWFTNVYQAQNIKPLPVYYQMKQALQPVLVSAELWGRHFYAGTKLPAKICVINDQEDGSVLAASELQWQLTDENDVPFASGKYPVNPVAHYTRQWIAPEITIPQNLPQGKVKGKLVLRIVQSGKTISENSYDLLFESKDDIKTSSLSGKTIAIFDPDSKIMPALDLFNIKYHAVKNMAGLFGQKADVYILSGVDETSADNIKQLRAMIATGAKVLISNSGNTAVELYPEYIRSVLTANGEIANIDIPESGVFNNIEPLELRYWNNNQREMPSVISGAFRINRNPNVEPLVSYIKIHGYLEGDIAARQQKLDQIKGFPVVKITDKGTVILSDMLFDKALTDPVAAQLLVNMLNDWIK